MGEVCGRILSDGSIVDISYRPIQGSDEVLVAGMPYGLGPFALGAQTADGAWTLVPHAAKLAASALAEQQDRAERAAIRKVALTALREDQVAAGADVKWIDARLAAVDVQIAVALP